MCAQLQHALVLTLSKPVGECLESIAIESDDERIACNHQRAANERRILNHCREQLVGVQCINLGRSCTIRLRPPGQYVGGCGTQPIDIARNSATSSRSRKKSRRCIETVLAEELLSLFAARSGRMDVCGNHPLKLQNSVRALFEVCIIRRGRMGGA